MPSDDEPTAALTSRTAIVAAMLLLGAIIVMVIVSQTRDASDEPASDAGPAIEGAAAPDFSLTSLDGEVVALSDYAGRPVLINFWASWCPPCREEFPALVAAHTTHLDDGLEILGITRNDGEDQSRQFVADAGAEWPILMDPEDLAWGAYRPVGLPTSYFVDGNGVVQRVHIGPLNDDQLANHLAAIGVPGQAPPSEDPA